MPPLLAVLQGTPLWVWGILVYLVVMGIYSLQPRVTSIYRLNALPTTLIIWSLVSLANHHGFTFVTLSAWFVSYIIGHFLIGFFIFGHTVQVTYLDPAQGTIKIEGSYVPLVLGLTCFTIKYCFGVAYALHPELRTLTIFQLAETSAMGLIVGILAGRVVAISKNIHSSRPSAHI